MFTSQLEKVSMARQRAFKIFIDTKDKFEKAIQNAESYITQNQTELNRLEEKTRDLSQTNLQLSGQIVEMKKSIGQIDKILGE